MSEETRQETLRHSRLNSLILSELILAELVRASYTPTGEFYSVERTMLLHDVSSKEDTHIFCTTGTNQIHT